MNCQYLRSSTQVLSKLTISGIYALNSLFVQRGQTIHVDQESYVIHEAHTEVLDSAFPRSSLERCSTG